MGSADVTVHGEPECDVAERVALLADRAGADSAASLIRHANRRAQSATARICLVGSTNVGKSRLANALMGADCLPVSVHPETGPPVVVRAAGEPVSDGQPAEPRTTEPLTTGQPPGPRAIRADLAPGSWLERGAMELVDTPGWESWSAGQLVGGRGLSALVADCDAVVVVTEARRALLATEQVRVRALATAAHTPPLVVVVTKLDEVGDEADEVMRRARRLVRQLAPEAQVLPGLSGPATSSDHIEHCRAVLSQLTGSRQRRAVRTLRRLHLLVATCDLVIGAAERALADVGWSDPVKIRAAQIWHVAHESALFHWIVLSAALDDRRAALTAKIAAEARRRQATHRLRLARQLSALIGSPEEQGFVRLHAIPQTEVALHEFDAWVTETVDRALAEESKWLRDALLKNRPGEELFQGLGAPRAGQVMPSATLPGVAASAAAAEADDASGWDASWLPEFVGTAIESVLSPFATGVVAQIVGAAGSALATEALEHGQAERRERTLSDVGRITEAAFIEHLARTEESIGQIYGRLLSKARDRDEQWWRLNTTALAARPDSTDHWRSLRDTAQTLRESALAHLSVVEGA